MLQVWTGKKMYGIFQNSFELLTQQQEEFDKAITGQQDAKTTLDNIAEFQQEVVGRS